MLGRCGDHRCQEWEWNSHSVSWRSCLWLHFPSTACGASLLCPASVLVIALAPAACSTSSRSTCLMLLVLHLHNAQNACCHLLVLSTFCSVLHRAVLHACIARPSLACPEISLMEGHLLYFILPEIVLHTRVTRNSPLLHHFIVLCQSPQAASLSVHHHCLHTSCKDNKVTADTTPVAPCRAVGMQLVYYFLQVTGASCKLLQ